jgi:hypothetical protein
MPARRAEYKDVFCESEDASRISFYLFTAEAQRTQSCYVSLNVFAVLAPLRDQ